MKMPRIFNSEMLTVAREARGLTQSELGNRLHIAAETISRIESGFRQPTTEQVFGFAKCLEFVDDFFFLDEQIRHFGSGCIYHRKRKKASQGTLKKLLGLINVRRIQLKKLLQSAEIETANQFVRLDIDEHGEPAEIARMVRTIWKIPPGPIQNLTRTLEDAGGIVLRCDFGTRDVDAISQWLTGSPPLFLVNSRIPTDRCRWTLAHELGHIMMHQIPTDRMEDEADKFAAEFLTPQVEIKPYLQSVTLPELANLKIYWKVSISSLLMRAAELKTISPRTKSYLFTLMSKRGWTLNEPVELPPEFPALFDELVNVYSSELGYTVSELSRVLLEPENRVRHFFVPQRAGPQIVA
jgi:Zn-dependent peptidase ImmA (M78 family)/DNA-binding XRE family transcriptional regulator